MHFFTAPRWDDPDPSFINVEVLDLEASKRLQVPFLLAPFQYEPSLPLPESFRKARTPQMAAPPSTPTIPYWLRATFSKFCKLPDELRKMIWVLAIADDCRVFEMRHPDLHIYHQNGEQIYEPPKLIKPRALQWACVESRNQFAEVELGGHYYLVNFEVDTIYFGPDSYWFHEILWRPPLSEEERAAYSGTDYLKQGWKKKQKWNHWRYGQDNDSWGEEVDFAEYQNCEPARHCKDPYHPLLADNLYAFERSQIRNVAFDLEFWEETGKRRIGGQLELLSRFPNAKKFILAAGDIGESMEVTRIDRGRRRPRKETYRRRLTTYKTTARRAVCYRGYLELLPGAAPTSFKKILNINIPTPKKFSDYPNPVTKCVTRGGEFNGHPNRFLEAPQRQTDHPKDLSYAPFTGDDDDDDKDDSDKDETYYARRYPRPSEVELLSNDQLFHTDEDIQELREALSNLTSQAVSAFHANAVAPADYDTEDEESDDDLDQSEDDQQTDTVVEVQLASNDEDSDNTMAGTEDQTGVDDENTIIVEHNLDCRREDGYVNRVVEITESKVHYGTLTYRVRFSDSDKPEKKRYSRKEPMFRSARCRELIAAFHATNPNEPNLETEESSVRKKYTYKNSRMNNAPTASASRSKSTSQPFSSNTSSSSPSSAEHQDSDDDMDVLDTIVVDIRSSTPLSTAPPSPSQASPSSEDQDAQYDMLDDD
jgi:hypothetical protein